MPMRRTEEVPQLKPSEMKEIEDLAEDALPECHVDERKRNAKKYNQLGSQVTSTLLTTALRGTTGKPALNLHPALAIIDLHTKEGSVLSGFMEMRSGFLPSLSLYYVGLCQDEKERAWVRNDIIQDMAEKLLEGKGPAYLQTGALSNRETPAELVPHMPAVPQLGVAVLLNAQSQEDSTPMTLKAPYGVIKKWLGHDAVGHRWAEWLKWFSEQEHCELGTEKDVNAGYGGGDGGGVDGQNSNGKRTATPHEEQSDPKKRQVDSKYLLPSDKVPQLLQSKSLWPACWRHHQCIRIF